MPHSTVQQDWKTSGQKLEPGLTILFSLGMLSRIKCLLAHLVLHIKNQQAKLCTYEMKRGTHALPTQRGHSFIPALVWHNNMLEVNPLEPVLAQGKRGLSAYRLQRHVQGAKPLLHGYKRKWVVLRLTIVSTKENTKKTWVEASNWNSRPATSRS